MLAGGRKRPLLPGGRPAMSPTKRTVMSLLARARAAQNKEPLPPPPSIVGAAHPTHPTHPQPTPLIQAALQLPAGALQPGTQAPVGPQVSQLQLAAAQAASPHTTASQRQSILPPHTQHQVIPPAIHGLLHAQWVPNTEFIRGDDLSKFYLFTFLTRFNVGSGYPYNRISW